MSQNLITSLLLFFSIINSMEHVCLKDRNSFESNTITISDDLNISKAIHASEKLELKILRQELTIIKRMEKKKPHDKALHNAIFFRKKLNTKLQALAHKGFYKQLSTIALYEKSLDTKIYRAHSTRRRARLSIKEHHDLLKLFQTMHSQTEQLNSFAQQGLQILTTTNLVCQLCPDYEPIRTTSHIFFTEIRDTYEKLVKTFAHSIEKLTEHQSTLKLKESSSILMMRLSGSL